MKPWRSLSPLLFAVICLLGGSITASGRSKEQIADSLKKVVAEQRALLIQADISGELRLSIAVRLHLSTLLKPKEAIRILEDGARIAEEAGLLEDEIAVRTYLAQAFANAGDHRKAYAEAMRISALGNERSTRQVERSDARSDSLMARARDQHVETVRGAMLRQLEVEEFAARQKKLTERWMVIALGIAAFAVLAVFFLILRTGRQAKRTGIELAALRSEVAALKVPSSNRVRDTSPVVADQRPPEMPPVFANAEESSTTLADEPLLAMFRKRGPERLLTMREARSRDDHEKVVRVIHTLKPQLVAIDPERFEALCAALTAPNSEVNKERWNSDLDRLEKAVERLLV